MFAFRLCLLLGFPHPDHLLAILTSEQFMQWRAFNVVEPIGGPVADYRFGMLARSILASVGAKDLPDPPDFFPWNNFTVVLSAEELCRQSELGMM